MRGLRMDMRARRALLTLVLGLGLVGPAGAVDDGPLSVPPAPPLPAAAVPAEQRYNDGLALTKRRDWRGAETAYRDALRGKPALAEAWNGLGYALRNQGRYEDALRAYYEALRLRPDYPEALEYLGEAYVQLGRLDEARRLLGRLRQLGAPEAEDLARALAGASAR
jgi:tetratricopeptide (TPR) repeat protein